MSSSSNHIIQIKIRIESAITGGVRDRLFIGMILTDVILNPVDIITGIVNQRHSNQLIRR
jgi:hypothetical protein